MQLKVSVGDVLELFTEDQYNELINNGKISKGNLENIPCALIITENYKDISYWLITELYEDDPGIAFGLYEHEGKPTFGVINLSIFAEMMENNLSVFNNLAFSTEYKIAVFKNVADELGEIITRDDGYEKAFSRAQKLANEQ